MQRTIYALLVGIDEYPTPIRSLSGCVNDIKRFNAFMKDRIDEDGFRYKSLVLRNSKAKRDAVIAGFREHLKKAREGDTALFYYAGHGSQEDCPPEFAYLEPDGKNETLVLYDSFQPDKYALADKELAQLIAEIAEGGAHCVIILDSCHSASGTRDPRKESEMRVRRTANDTRARPAESYIFKGTPIKNIEGQAGWLALPEGKHVLLAACQSYETAKEITVKEDRGVFSYYLLNTLLYYAPAVSYRDLINRTRTLVKNEFVDQRPQLEATDGEIFDQEFLSGAVLPKIPYHTLSHDRSDGWMVDVGGIHGFRDGGGIAAKFAVFDKKAPANDLQDLSKRIGEATVTQVRPAQSLVALELAGEGNTPDDFLTYKAITIVLPQQPAGVELNGDPAALEHVRRTLATKRDNALYLEESARDAAMYSVEAANDRYRVSRTTDNKLLIDDIRGQGEDAVEKLVQRLAHIERWRFVTALDNDTSRLRGKIEMEIVPAEGGDGEGRYVFMDNQPIAASFFLKLTNKGDEPLYCSVLNLTDSFGIHADPRYPNGVRLAPGEEYVLMNEDKSPIEPYVPKALMSKGVTETTDIFKVIVSNESFNAAGFAQGNIDEGETRSMQCGSTRGAPTSTLDLILEQTASRAVYKEKSAVEWRDWNAEALTVTTVQPKSLSRLSSTDSIELANAFSVAAHAELRAHVRLATEPHASRDASGVLLPAGLQEISDEVKPFSFVPGYLDRPGLSVLELADVENPESVSSDRPLRIEMPGRIPGEETILAVGYDDTSKCFLPVGIGKPNTDEIEIFRLPSPMEKSRTLSRSVRILFRKIVCEKLGLPDEYPILSIVEPDQRGQNEYIKDTDTVRERVRSANTVLLYIHGIMGSTRTMVDSAAHIGVDHDLVLSFDYENLNTPIEQTARALKAQLREIGLGENHGKMLHIVAHSMGGLVTRWFIEREGGKYVVQRLVMLGTPNTGSPWPSVQEWATGMLGLALNSMTPVSWVSSVLGGLVGAIETVDSAVDQLAPGSDFLGNLNTSDPVSVPYHVIVGDTSQLAKTQHPDYQKRVRLLFGRLLSTSTLHRLTELAFFGAPNDMAVSVASAKALPAGFDVRKDVVTCDHLSYFSNPDSLKRLGDALKDG